MNSVSCCQLTNFLFVYSDTLLLSNILTNTIKAIRLLNRDHVIATYWPLINTTILKNMNETHVLRGSEFNSQKYLRDLNQTVVKLNRTMNLSIEVCHSSVTL